MATSEISPFADKMPDPVNEILKEVECLLLCLPCDGHVGDGGPPV